MRLQFYSTSRSFDRPLHNRRVARRKIELIPQSKGSSRGNGKGLQPGAQARAGRIRRKPQQQSNQFASWLSCSVFHSTKNNHEQEVRIPEDNHKEPRPARRDRHTKQKSQIASIPQRMSLYKLEQFHHVSIISRLRETFSSYTKHPLYVGLP